MLVGKGEAKWDPFGYFINTEKCQKKIYKQPREAKWDTGGGKIEQNMV